MKDFGIKSSQKKGKAMRSLSEIQKQIAELQKEEAAAIKKEVGEVIADMKAKIKAYGITATELGFKTIKYRDGTNEWTGTGPCPKWLKTLEAAGRKRDEFLV